MRVLKTIVSGLFVLGAFGLFSATAVHAKGKLQLKTAVRIAFYSFPWGNGSQIQYNAVIMI